jgi:Transposase DDE domain
MASMASLGVRINPQIVAYVTEAHVQQIAQELDYHFRRRVLTPVLTVHLMLLQVLAQASLRCLRHLAGLQISAQAICKAKARLPLQLLIRLLEHLSAQAVADHGQPRWHELRVVLGDAMHVKVEDTPELARRYRRYTGPQRSLSAPIPQVLALLDWGTGLIRKVILLPYDRQELSCFTRMFKYLTPQDVVLLDRAFASFGHVALLLQQGVQLCIRLQRSMVVRGRGSGHHRRIRRLGPQDLLVNWSKGHRPKAFNRTRWAALPEQIPLRQIAYRLVRPGFRTHWVWVITSLADPQTYPAQAIVQLYDRRWQVEVYLRDLKISLAMKKLASRSVTAVRKEVLCFALLYNLVRLAMVPLAQQQQTLAMQVSFKETLCWLLWSGEACLQQQITVNPRRRRATQPRRLKDHRRRYLRLNHPRAQLQLPAYEALL